MAITKIGTPELFDFSATNTALQLPTGPTSGTGGRPSNPSTGEWRFNTTLKYVEYWDGGAWRQIDTEATGNPDDFPSQNFNVNTYFGTGAARTIDAKFNEAANFNGASSGSQIFIADADVFSPANNDLSFSVWVKTSSTSGGYFVSKQDDGTVTYEWQFYMNTNGTVVIGIFTSAGSTIATATSTATVNDGNWHNVAFVIDTNTSITVYVDKAGVTNSSWSGTMSNTSTDVLLGAGGGVPSFRLQGMLDQARFFNTAITQSQIDSLYDSETTTTAATLDFPSGAGCFAAYQLDGDASDVGGTYGGVETNIGYTGFKFTPDLVWIKQRSSPTRYHILSDTIRGANKQLYSNESTAQQSDSGLLTQFNSNGFNIGNSISVNDNNVDYVAWCWYCPTSFSHSGSGTLLASSGKSNQDAGISIVKFDYPSGNSSTVRTVKHNLSTAPDFILYKPYIMTASGNSNWFVYHKSMGAGSEIYLNLAIGSSPDANRWNNTAPTGGANGVVTLGTSFSQYADNFYGGTTLMYCMHDVAGYQKIGSYTGTNSTNGPIVTTGFEPAFLLIKGTQSTTQWLMIDNKRSPSNPRNKALFANLPDIESTNNNIEFFTNGFQPITTDGDSNRAENYIYLAIAADKDSSVPTQANSFSPTLYTGNGATQNIYTPFAPDFTWLKERSGTQWHSWYDSIRGVGNRIASNSVNGQNNDPNRLTSFNPNGFSIGTDGDTNTLNDTYVSWNWKAGGLPTINNDGDIPSIVSANQNAGFSIVTFTCPSTNQNFNLGHGLGVKPDMVIMKKLNAAGGWLTWHKDLSVESYYLQLNSDLGESGLTQDDRIWGQQSFTSTTISTSTGYSYDVNDSVVSYCFANIAGYQKAGSYTGTGATGNSIYTTDNGQSGGANGFQPRFVMLKVITANDNWLMYDNERGVDVALFANLDNEEDSYVGRMVFNSNGFTLNTTDSGWNGLGQTYIYLAIA